MNSAARQAIERKGTMKGSGSSFSLKKSASVLDKNFKRAGHYFDEADEREDDIDFVCPHGQRIREGLWQKKCAGPQGGELVIWKPRMAVLSTERLYFASQEHGATQGELQVWLKYSSLVSSGSTML